LVSSLLDLKPNEKIYVVSGQVKDIKEKSNTLFFQLCDSYVCLPCVYFNPTDKDIQFVSRNQEIKVKAKYTTFNNSPELIVFSFLWVIL
jgi:exonuclease VII large subunit